MKKIKNKLNFKYIYYLFYYKVYIYRYDIFSLFVLFFLICAFLFPLYSSGHVVFSDMAFGFTSRRYIEEIFGIWNERWSTSTLLNTPRMLFIFPIYMISKFFDNSAVVLLKLFITILITTSAFSMYIFTKRLVSIYFSRQFNFFKVFALIIGALFYSLNPWVIFRIQHIYLLCGYCLFPLVLTFFFNSFDPKFQAQLIPSYNIFNKYIYKRNVIDLFLLSLVFSIASAAIHYFFYGLIYLGIIGVAIVLKNVFVNIKELKKMKYFLTNIITKIIIFGTFFVFFSSYWLFSYVGSMLLKAQASQHNVNVIDTLAIFSRNSTIKNVLYLISYWWPMFNMNDMPITFYIFGAVFIIFILYSMIVRSIKHNIILFFTLTSILFMFLSTGVTLSFFANTFIWIVTKIPIIGSIFRDPNKFVGIMTIGFSVLLTFGIEDVFNKMKGEDLYTYLRKTALLLIMIVSFWYYLNPFYENFIKGFYYPVTIPEEYLSLQNKLESPNKFDSKVLYIPIADNMTQSNTGVATPIWNNNNNKDGVDKATGDLHIYTSQKNTIFQHEGNVKSINYFMNYIQNALDKGLSMNLGKLIKIFGVNEMVYHKDYKGQDERQKFNLDFINIQDGLELKDKEKIFSIYKIKDPLSYLRVVPKKLYTPYGYTRIDSYMNIKGFDIKENGVIFSSIEPSRNILDANEGDYIEANSFEDVYLSNLPKEKYLLPFEFINDGNAFLKWSKTLIQNTEWLWYMSSQSINNFPFDFDFNSGIAVTFATSKLDIPPYKISSTHGKLVADFDSLLRMEKFFKPDNPQIFDVIANPKAEYNNIPTLQGQIIRGDPKNIWQVAKSGILEAKPDNPYKFNIVVSGRGSNKMHVKVRFFDENMIETGISYVVAPSEEINFSGVNFYGEYVSPANSKYMRIDLLTYQRPEQKNYWWIHDIKIENMEDYKAQNTFTMERKESKENISDIYTRVFVNKKGGELVYDINGESIAVNTFDTNINQFKWVKLGTFKLNKGVNKIIVKNTKGFNAVNVMSIIPKDEDEILKFPVELAINRSKVLSMLEAENEFSYEGNMQTTRNYPTLSLGKGISSQNGVLSKEWEAIKSDEFYFSVKLNFEKRNNSKLDFEIKDEEDKIVFNKNMVLNDYINQNAEKSDLVVENIFVDRNFPSELTKIPRIIDNCFKIDIGNIYLKKGKYKIKIKFDSNVKSISSIDEFHKFDPTEIKVKDFVKDTLEDYGYSDCEKITFEMMNHTWKDNELHIEYDKTCSNDWYTYATKKINVVEKEEYLFNIKAISEEIRRRHMKVVFLDNDDNVIDITYINDVEEIYKSKWNSYEQILRAPEGAKKMQVHLLCKGNKFKKGYAIIKDFSLIPYKDMILIDYLFANTNSNIDNFFKNNTTKSEMVLDYKRVDSMKRELKLKNLNGNKILINYMESPNPLWDLHINNFHERGTLPLYGVSTGFITTEKGNGEIVIILRTLYYFSWIVFAFGFIVVVIVYKRSNNRYKNLINNNKKRKKKLK